MPLTHRLASKIEETPIVGSGNWNKVTVILPNNSYILSKVELVNNKLSIVFDFSDSTNYQQIQFAFLLSGFGINAIEFDFDNIDYSVIGIQNPNVIERQNALGSFPTWFETLGDQYSKNYIFNEQVSSRKAKLHKCPPNCPPPSYD